MDTHELAWAAGFFDGEGSTYWSRPRSVARVTIKQNDRESLDRVRAAVGMGRVNGPYARKDGELSKNPYYTYDLSGREQIERFHALIAPWLGAQKRSQALSVLSNYKRRVRSHNGAVTDETRSEIVRLRAEGRTYRDIARSTGVSLGSAHAIARG